MKKEPLIILTGPTAVGKTELSIALAKAVNGEIISADSMQVYRYMDIGTAKITKEEMQGVKHYLVDEIEPSEGFDVARFKSMATNAIQKIRENGHIPVVVGGTGFYIQALLYDSTFEDDESDYEYRDYLQGIADTKGAEVLHDMLKEADPESAEAIHANNVKRVIRALEFYKTTGRKISEHNNEQRAKESPYNFCYFVLNDKREILYDRINRRVDIMFDNGLLDEVKHLSDMGLVKDDVAMHIKRCSIILRADVTRQVLERRLSRIQDILPKDSLHGFGESRWLHGWIFPRYEEKMHFRICLNN